MNTTILLGTLIYFGILSYSVKTNTPVRKIACSIFVVAPLLILRDLFSGIIQVIDYRPIAITLAVVIGAFMAFIAYCSGCGAYIIATSEPLTAWRAVCEVFAIGISIFTAYSSIEIPRKLLNSENSY